MYCITQRLEGTEKHGQSSSHGFSACLGNDFFRQLMWKHQHVFLHINFSMIFPRVQTVHCTRGKQGCFCPQFVDVGRSCYNRGSGWKLGGILHQVCKPFCFHVNFHAGIICRVTGHEAMYCITQRLEGTSKHVQSWVFYLRGKRLLSNLFGP